MQYLLYFLLIFFFIEICFFIIIRYIRKNNQWFITYIDKKPILDKNALIKFFKVGYDSEIGWIRKPNTDGVEQGENSQIRWSTNLYGARHNGINEKYDNDLISLYGDSFTFARQVGDESTWGYFLSSKLSTNILNFGVGNYGIDQALLRLKRQYKLTPTKYVVMGVVPDTISRILSMWKHYYEYGNTFGFKPRYILDNEDLILVDNIINSQKKFNDYENNLKAIQEYDYFYKNKFIKELIEFPFILSFFRNFKKNIKLVMETLSNGKVLVPSDTIMKKNMDWRLMLYENNKVLELFQKILDEYFKLSTEYNFIPILIIMPQKDDLVYIKQKNYFYKKFINSINKGIKTIDITEYLINLSKEEIDLLYCDSSDYGGHFSIQGNKKISEILHKEIFNA